MTAIPNPWISGDVPAVEVSEPAQIEPTRPPASPELFSDFAARRIAPAVSPPLPPGAPRVIEPDMQALFDAIAAEPLIVDEDPPPLFLRQPPAVVMERRARPSLLRALFELSERD